MRRELINPLDDLGEFIRNQREVTQLSLRRLAELAGVSNPYLSQIERGLRRPSAEILQQIAKALRISAESLYVRAGILDPDVVGEVNVREAIHRDPHLTAAQKHSLLTVYDSFVAHQGPPGAPDGSDGRAAPGVPSPPTPASPASPGGSPDPAEEPSAGEARAPSSDGPGLEERDSRPTE